MWTTPLAIVADTSHVMGMNTSTRPETKVAKCYDCKTPSGLNYVVGTTGRQIRVDLVVTLCRKCAIVRQTYGETALRTTKEANAK